MIFGTNDFTIYRCAGKVLKTGYGFFVIHGVNAWFAHENLKPIGK